jgi:hypothetical protein
MKNINSFGEFKTLNEYANHSLGYTLSEELRNKLIRIKNSIAKKILGHSEPDGKKLDIDHRCNFTYGGNQIKIADFIIKKFPDENLDDIYLLIHSLEKECEIN